MAIITPLTTTQTAAEESQAKRDSYPMRFLVALDTFANVVMDGNPDETISTRAARDARKNMLLGKLVSATLDHLQSNHGADAAAGDAERAEAEASVLSASGIINP